MTHLLKNLTTVLLDRRYLKYAIRWVIKLIKKRGPRGINPGLGFLSPQPCISFQKCYFALSITSLNYIFNN